MARFAKIYRPVSATKPQSRFAEVELEQDSSSNASTKPLTWPGPWGRIGGLAGTAILLGTVLQLGTFGFLVFLWTARGSDPSGAKAPSVWRDIFLKGAGTRVVTVCALIIRSIVGLQATVCTGLAAALVLEARNVVDMSNAATFSVLRAVNGGPISFVTPLARTPAKLFTSFPAVLILVIWLGSMAISFSSTILLSDFRNVQLLLSSSTSLVPALEASAELVGPFGLSTPGPDPGIWQQSLQTYPTFGEATMEPPTVRDGFADTGLIKRSLIPLQAQSRKNLRSYQGVSAVYTSRAACTRPTISGSITGIAPITAISHQMEDANLSGSITWESQNDIPFLNGLSCGPTGSKCKSLPISCGVPYAYIDSDQAILPRNPTSLCNIRSYRYNFLPNEPVPALFLVFNTDVNTDFWANASLAAIQRNESGIHLPAQTNSHEWAVMKFGDHFTLNASLCLINSTLTMEDVSLSTTEDPLEPEIQYNASNKTWSTDAIVNMVDTTANASYVSRGIMSLDSWTDVSSDELNEMYAQSPNYNPDLASSTEVTRRFLQAVIDGINTNDFYQQGGINFSVYICGVCSPLGGSQISSSTWQTHPYISLVFHAVANRTASIAQAMQATFFWLYQAQYSNAIPGFDMGNDSTMTWSAEALVPVGRNGLIVVGVLVLVNLICVFAVTGLFLWRTHWSLYGNVWHAVAQLVAGSEIRPILEDATAATDEEIGDKLKSEGIKRIKVGLWDQGGGRLAVASGSDHAGGA
ncbi:uncharacterized protein TRIVIDRAFT_209738 [Trichoderma virens Gv29-8]|uniref:Uncharacterized protein n=1 Tax=Hypocrea virens (strain Gv29-8 / FGSC 10586) TaxID=413071 RepID=G9MZE5_HYPVG|nr:uncharacterized protein TRIVIDRAFT_209738 [Trichoderma virens Gv29-8]EHK20002.1 hypothetical protein TRIVIDRAFT_209738 [Trichoderma virens Gv29-8]